MKNPCKKCVARPSCTKQEECKEYHKYNFESFGGSMGRLFGILVNKIDRMEWPDVIAWSFWALVVTIFVFIGFSIAVDKKIVCYYPKTELVATQTVFKLNAKIDWDFDAEFFKTTDYDKFMNMFNKVKICGGNHEKTGETVNSDKVGDARTGSTGPDL